MRSRHRQIILEVSPTRRELAVFENGELIGHRDARSIEDAHASDWGELVRLTESELAGWVPALGVTGQPVDVIYTGPDSAATVYDCPASAGEKRAKLAARLAMADTISFPLDQNTHAEYCLFEGRRAGAGEQPQRRTLAIADTEATVLALSLSIERCGLKPRRFVPATGAALAAAVEQLARVAADGAPHVVLWIGEHASVIAGGEAGQVAFARLVPVGTETLADALSRTPASGRSEPGLALDRITARAMLQAYGIPSADGWRGSVTTLDARAVLPLLQPVLQRLAVEIKQSIRFGLAADARGRAALTVCGPGSRIERLGEAISAGAGIGLSEHGPDDATAGAAVQGDIAAVLALGDRVPVLVTRAAAAQRSLRATRRALIVGAALGLLAIGADGFESWSRAREARATLRLISGSDSPETSQAVRTVRAALNAGMGVRSAQARAREHLGDEARHAEFLQSLAQITNEGIEISEITIAEDETGARCGLRGRAFGDAETTDSHRFQAYATALGACPVVLGTTLGETRRTVERGRQTLSFTLTLDLIELPAAPIASAARHAEGAGP